MDCKSRVYSWGGNEFGQLGHGLGSNLGNPVDKALPTMI